MCISTASFESNLISRRRAGSGRGTLWRRAFTPHSEMKYLLLFDPYTSPFQTFSTNTNTFGERGEGGKGEKTCLKGFRQKSFRI
nr:MAG TPA: hypothetical protein [Caudoviricetes sp.]